MNNPPIEIELLSVPTRFGGNPSKITITPGITTFVGPNGSGKTQILRLIKDHIREHLQLQIPIQVRYLSAGRASPFEKFKADADIPGGRNYSTAHVGSFYHIEQRNSLESITGDFLALSQRSDLRLKVQARLEGFLARSIKLNWSQSGLEVRIAPTTGEQPYNANDEASGILQLAGLLAAIYNDEITVLLIDEPEISLHPQYQAFIMQEIRQVAGDPRSDPTKKIIVIATHSPSILTVKTAADLPKIVFFNDQHTPPIQISETSQELENRKLKSLVSRLTATHQLAFFARNVLLVEGPSDEIIAGQLARKLRHPILPANTQIIPVVGKSGFLDAIRLFEMMGKNVFVLADLDALTDSNELINKFNIKKGAQAIANSVGFSSLIELDTGIRQAFAQAVDKHWDTIKAVIETQKYWIDSAGEQKSEQTCRRATLAALMDQGPGDLDARCGTTDFSSIHARYEVLFTTLEKVGCFILRKGTIEDYYITMDASPSKVESAAFEAESFENNDEVFIAQQYADILRALRASAPIRPVDENAQLRERLGGALGAAFQFLTPSTSSDELQGRAELVQPDINIFKLENVSDKEILRIRVSLKSKLFDIKEFPFEVSHQDNLFTIIRNKLPSPT